MKATNARVGCVVIARHPCPSPTLRHRKLPKLLCIRPRRWQLPEPQQSDDNRCWLVLAKSSALGAAVVAGNGEVCVLVGDCVTPITARECQGVDE